MGESLTRGRDALAAGVSASPVRRALVAAAGAVRARGAVALCAVSLCVMCVNMLTVVARKSITNDEIVMIPSSYYYLAAGNSDLVREHPPLSKLLAALPLLFIQPNEVPPRRADAPRLSTEEQEAWQARFWEDNRDAFETISFWARVPAAALTVSLGVLVFVFARRLFGERAAVIAVSLFSLEPTVLAHGRVVQTDIPATFGYLLLFYTLYIYFPAPTSKRALGLGLAAGVAALTKFSMLLAGPVIAAAFAALLWQATLRRRRDRAVIAAHACLTLLVVLLLINAAYSFDHHTLQESEARWVAGVFPARAETAVRAVLSLSHLLPTDFVLGGLWQLRHNSDGHPASLLGMYSRTGWWYYFPVAFTLKTTLPFLLLSVASLAWGCHELLRKRDLRFLALLAPFVLYTAFVMLSRIDIGVRYYLPAFPPLFILGGALLDRLLKSGRASRKRAGLAVACVLLGWVGVEAVRAYPDQMSYFNQLASRRPHWRYLSDSNVEWGDDVRELAEYLRARGETRVGAATLGGYLTLRFYGVEYVDLFAPPEARSPRPRYVAIGASFLNGSTVPGGAPSGQATTDEQRVNFFDAYRWRKPETIIGGSIYIFREPD